MISLFIFIATIVLILANMVFKSSVGKNNYLVQWMSAVIGFSMVILPFTIIFEIAKWLFKF